MSEVAEKYLFATGAPLPMRALSVEQVLAITGISRPTFYEHAFAGRIKARKLGRRTIVMESDLRAYLESLPTLEGSRGADRDREVAANA